VIRGERLVLKRAQFEPLCISCLFIDDIVGVTGEENTHAPLTGQISTPGLLFAGCLALGALIIQTLRKDVDTLQQGRQCTHSMSSGRVRIIFVPPRLC
jgi:hypothetical protein